MINSPEFYRELGYKCGLARVRKDEATARFHKDHFNNAKRLEKREDWDTCNRQFDLGYSDAQPCRR